MSRRRWRVITRGHGTSHLPRREYDYRVPVALVFVLEKSHVCHTRRDFSVVDQTCDVELLDGKTGLVSGLVPGFQLPGLEMTWNPVTNLTLSPNDSNLF